MGGKDRQYVTTRWQSRKTCKSAMLENKIERNCGHLNEIKELSSKKIKISGKKENCTRKSRLLQKFPQS